MEGIHLRALTLREPPPAIRTRWLSSRIPGVLLPRMLLRVSRTCLLRSLHASLLCSLCICYAPSANATTSWIHIYRTYPTSQQAHHHSHPPVVYIIKRMRAQYINSVNVDYNNEAYSEHQYKNIDMHIFNTNGARCGNSRTRRARRSPSRRHSSQRSSFSQRSSTMHTHRNSNED